MISENGSNNAIKIFGQKLFLCYFCKKKKKSLQKFQSLQQADKKPETQIFEKFHLCRNNLIYISSEIFT